MKDGVTQELKPSARMEKRVQASRKIERKNPLSQFREVMGRELSTEVAGRTVKKNL